MNFTVPPNPALQEQWNLTLARFHEWLQLELFTPKWWVLLAVFLITAIFWWIKVDKARLTEITLYTCLIIVFIIVLDELGEELSLWFYSVDIIFLFPPITAVNITSMPLVYMLLYQRFGSWKSFMLATTIMSAVFCFVFEPIFIWGGIYGLLSWKSYYGFPIYIFVAVCSKFIVNLIYSVSDKHTVLS